MKRDRPAWPALHYLSPRGGVVQIEEAVANQNRNRRANCKLRGSLTAVTWPNVGDGFAGYAPAPKLSFSVRLLRRLSELNASAIASRCRRSPMRKLRLRRELTLKKSLPVPALRPMNAPLTIGRPAVALNRGHAGGDVERQRRVVLQHAAQLEAVARRSRASGARHRRVDRAVEHEAMPLVVVGAAVVPPDVRIVDRRAEEELADVVHRLRIACRRSR